MGIWHPLDKPEGAATDNGIGVAALAGLEAVRAGGLWGIKHQARPIAGQHVQEERVGPFHVHLHGERIDHFDALHRLIESPHAGSRFRVHEAVDAEFDGLGVHPVAVMEKSVIAQLESPRQAVIGRLPSGRHVAHELAVGCDVDQPATDIHRHPHHFVARRSVEIEVGNFVAVGHPQGAAAFWLRGKQQPRQEDRQHQKDNSLEERVCGAHGVPTPSDPIHGSPWGFKRTC